MKKIPTSKCEICGAPCCRGNRHCMTHKPNGPNPKPIAERVWARVTRGPNCWEWTGATDRKGYGKMGVGSMKDGTRRTAIVPRLAWEVTFGAIPDGLCVCHHCDNPLCCRPDHLFLGTQAENLGDMVAKGRSRGGGPCGEAHGRAKLTDAEVAKIRALSGTMFQREIGARFGVSQSHVSYITLGKGR